MTIGEKGQHQNFSMDQSLMNSNEQNGLLDGSAQKRLLISDVQWDLQKKQWRVTGLQQHDAIQENRNLQNNELRKTPTKRRRKRKIAEDRTVETLFEKGHNQKRKEAVGGLNHLLILADSAELLAESRDNCIGAKRNHQYLGSPINPDAPCLQNRLSTPKSSGQNHTENLLDASQGNHNHEAEKTALPLHGKIRLTDLRRLARSKSHPLIQETKESNALVYVDPKSFADIQDAEKIATDRNQELMGSKDVEALLARCYSQMVDGTQEDKIHEEHDKQKKSAQGGCQQIDFRERPCITKAVQIYDGRHHSTMPHHIITHQPLQNTNASQLGTDKLRDPMKQHASFSSQGQVNAVVKDQLRPMSVIETPLPLHVSQTQKDHKLIARERRMLRTHQRKKRAGEKQVHDVQQSSLMSDDQMKQMNATGQQWQWQMWDFQNWSLWEAERQRAWQNVCTPLQGDQLSAENHVLGRPQHPNVVTRSDRDKLLANNDFPKSTIIDFRSGLSTSLDQSVEQQNHESVKTYTEKTTSVKGRTRVSHLKREARLRSADSGKEA